MPSNLPSSGNGASMIQRIIIIAGLANTSLFIAITMLSSVPSSEIGLKRTRIAQAARIEQGRYLRLPSNQRVSNAIIERCDSDVEQFYLDQLAVDSSETSEDIASELEAQYDCELLASI